MLTTKRDNLLNFMILSFCVRLNIGQPWQPACRHFPAHDKARATQTMISLSRPSLAKIKLGPALSSYMVEALSF